MEDHCIINTIKQQNVYGLVIVLCHDVLDMLESRMLGKRTRGRKRLQLMSNIMRGNFLQVSKETSWRQMSVKSFRDRSQWPAIFSSTPEDMLKTVFHRSVSKRQNCDAESSSSYIRSTKGWQTATQKTSRTGRKWDGCSLPSRLRVQVNSAGAPPGRRVFWWLLLEKTLPMATMNTVFV